MDYIEISGIQGGEDLGPLFAQYPIRFDGPSAFITPFTPPGALVGGFTIVAGEVSSISLVPGVGSEDNGYFQIVPRPVEDPLFYPDFYLLNNSFLDKEEYNIRVRVDDPSGPGLAGDYYLEQRYNLRFLDLLLHEGLPSSNQLGTSLVSLFSSLLSTTSSNSTLGELTAQHVSFLGSIASQEQLSPLEPLGGITAASQESLGVLTVSTSCALLGISSTEKLQNILVNYFSFSETISWNVNVPIETSFAITWSSGQGILKWYRVQGCCMFPTSQGSGSGIPGPFYAGGCAVSNFESTDSKCVGATGKQLFIQNILATSVSDVCRQLDNYNMKWQVCKIQVYSNPAGPLVDSCNKLIDVPFSSLPECMEIALQTDAIVNISFEDRAFFCTSFVGSGGVEALGEAFLTGTADSLSYFYYNGYGGLDLSGEGIVSSSWRNTLDVDASFGFYVSYFDAVMSNRQPPSTLRGSTTLVRTLCGNCTEIPSILYCHNNLERSYIISRFLSKNSISFPEYFTMYYSSKLRSWVSNYRVSGVGDLGDETWGFVSTWSCLNKKADEESSPYWKYSMLISRSSSDISFDTRISIIFPPEELCRLIGNFSTDFSLRLNTITSYVENSFVNVTDYVILIDKIGVFKDNIWTSDPWLEVRLSRSIASPTFQTVDLSSIIP